jgi:HKD family nuclease
MLAPGIYERLLDEELADLILEHPELVAPLEKLDDECAPQAYSQFIGQLLRAVLPNAKPQARLGLVNRLIDLIGAEDGLDYVRRKRLIAGAKTVLRQVRSKQQTEPFSEPETPISVSSLLTGAAQDPQLDREIRAEMLTADRVDLLVSFIKWTGLSLLLSAFEDLEARSIPVRIITTSYMGASDPRAVEWLAARKNVQVKVSYDTERTRLHAKAYHFLRKSGFSTAYIGSANMSRPAMTSGLEWTVKVTAQD